MTDFLDAMETRVLLCDGAMGTQLQERGLKPGACPELFNFDEPDIVRAIHSAYFDAGADMVETNTFGASPLALTRYQLDGKTEDINRRAVELAKDVCPPGKFVAGSIGPSTHMPEPYGDVTCAEMEDNFAVQARGLAAGGADILVIETQTDLIEAECAITGARRETDLPLIVTMTFNPGKRGYRTVMGTSPEDAVEKFFALGAVAVGANCSVSMGGAVSIMQAMHTSADDKPLMAQPNAGQPKLIAGKAVYGHGPDDMAKRVHELLDAGTRIVGGCCGTTPAHIAAFRAVLDAR